MKKIVFLFYGLMSYLAFLGAILYAIGFVGNLPVPKTIDGEPKTTLFSAILVNACLVLLFALQHSIMARPAFKRWLTSYIPKPIERSTYVLLSSACLLLMMWQWQPIGTIVWKVKNDAVQVILFILYLSGWGIVFISTFLISHFDLFGLRQVWLYFTGKPYKQLPFGQPLFYRLVRHPLYLGFILAFWSASTMTVAHLLFALLTTVYIFIAIRLEEKDLVTVSGAEYGNYKSSSPMIISFLKKKSANNDLSHKNQFG
jgi:protein-S-isoprenylcysteine O-methyltransferase Ste14